MKGRVLIIAGSDSGGGAGIQADIKAVTALGGYAMTALTALTAQNTEGVVAIHDVPVDFIAQQVRVVLDDLGADCIKTGMLHRADVIEVVADTIAECAPGVFVVVDPVMIAKGGARLLETDAVEALTERLVPMATLVTPNVPEAEALSGVGISDGSGAEAAARTLAQLGPDAVMIKGGHLVSETVTDFLLFGDCETKTFSTPRIDTRHTHGTGCTLASAAATGIAQGLSVLDAIARARAYVIKAIESAPGFGRGHGPLDHAHTVATFETKD
ncbi:MAG: Hydroxymethylpyrimidine/phosphomethylpyrimidine kinase [Alphaproteobacteria bacterium MarineAlpha3_Bin4]|nr:MAG: Hydroxymethylpyrimidine/phosphomethylpyrimidine kinase [Alphaproteobacteria bacterium MarineAlpha3_Bin4]